ncbi:MAG: type I restriction endonuclease subunit R [Rhodoferax sp.]|nr:type I restriction endonuclease subunit R [Rhodoferax sp.]
MPANAFHNITQIETSLWEAADQLRAAPSRASWPATCGYDFKRSEEDGATVRLVYENRGEKLGLAKLDLHDRIAAAVDAADLDLDPDQTALLEKLLGRDYEVITADERLERLERIATDFIDHFKHWGFDIIAPRSVMKLGFETADGQRVDVETAFKNPRHPFRIAVVCAMWLTGFDVECLATLYIDKPMRAHTLMQAIARANRVFPGKDFGLIVDYNGMLKSLRQALAQYALGDDGGEAEIVAPIEERVAALADAIAVTEAHLLELGFAASSLQGSKGFTRIELLADAVEAVVTSWTKVYQPLPEPPYTPDDKAQVAQLVYRHIWQQSVRDQLPGGRWGLGADGGPSA